MTAALRFCGRSYSFPCCAHNDSGLILITASAATAARNFNCYLCVIYVFQISDEITSLIINTHLQAPISGGKKSFSTHRPLYSKTCNTIYRFISVVKNPYLRWQLLGNWHSGLEARNNVAHMYKCNKDSSLTIILRHFTARETLFFFSFVFTGQEN